MNGKPLYAPGQIVVMFQPEIAIEEVRRAVSERGLRIISESSGERGHRVLVSVPEGFELDWSRRFGELPNVQYASLNAYRYAC